MDLELQVRRTALGPPSLTVSRCLPGPVAEVDSILRRFLAKEQFHLRRDFGTSSTWTRRQDVGARVRIQYDKSVHRRLLPSPARFVRHILRTEQSRIEVRAVGALVDGGATAEQRVMAALGVRTLYAVRDRERIATSL